MKGCLNKICVTWMVLWMFILGIGDMTLAFYVPLYIQWYFAFLVIIGWSVLIFLVWTVTGVWVHERYVGKLNN